MEHKDLATLQLTPEVRMLAEEYFRDQKEFKFQFEKTIKGTLEGYMTNDNGTMVLIRKTESQYEFHRPASYIIPDSRDNFKVLGAIFSEHLQKYVTDFYEKLEEVFSGLQKKTKITYEDNPVLRALEEAERRPRRPRMALAPEVVPQAVVIQDNVVDNPFQV